MHYVYILKSEHFRKSYVGHTGDIRKRLIQHNSGESHYTKRYKPWILIYNEAFLSLEDAIKREKFLKSRSGRREMKKIFENLARSSNDSPR